MRVPLSRQKTGRIPKSIQPIVQRMTGWYRNQWARAGYPVDKAANFAVERLPQGRA